MRQDRGLVLKLAAIAVFWLALGRFLPDLLWRALPRALLDSLSLPVYSMLCQVLTTLAGVAVSTWALERPRAVLGLERPALGHLAISLLLAPALFVVASYVALEIAEPYLLAELAREGPGASRKNAGAFGRAVTQAPLVLTLLWGAVLAAVAEELAFRGALFAAIEHALPRRRWFSGPATVALAGSVFGAMHADMHGSVGIVRVASTTLLGLACGTARMLSGSVFVAMIVHLAYNSISLGLGRGLFRSDSEPLVSVVPNRLLALAVVGVLGALAVIAARRAWGRSTTGPQSTGS